MKRPGELNSDSLRQEPVRPVDFGAGMDSVRGVTAFLQDSHPVTDPSLPETSSLEEIVDDEGTE